MVSLLFGFNGRINRAQYWLGVCIGSFGGMMLFFLLGLMTAPAGNFAKTMDPIAAMQLVSSMGVSFGLPLVVMGWIGFSTASEALPRSRPQRTLDPRAHGPGLHDRIEHRRRPHDGQPS